MGMIRFTDKNSEGEVWISEDQIVSVSSAVRGSRIHAGGRVFEVSEPLPVALARLGIEPPAPEPPGSFADPLDRV